MTASRADIVRWLDEAKERGATHLIVAVDTFDHDNYPVFVMPGENARERYEEIAFGGNMQGVDEVYSMALPLEDQLREHRARHFD